MSRPHPQLTQEDHHSKRSSLTPRARKQIQPKSKPLGKRLIHLLPPSVPRKMSRLSYVSSSLNHITTIPRPFLIISLTFLYLAFHSLGPNVHHLKTNLHLHLPKFPRPKASKSKLPLSKLPHRQAQLSKLPASPSPTNLTAASPAPTSSTASPGPSRPPRPGSPGMMVPASTRTTSTRARTVLILMRRRCV